MKPGPGVSETRPRSQCNPAQESVKPGPGVSETRPRRRLDSNAQRRTPKAGSGSPLGDSHVTGHRLQKQSRKDPFCGNWISRCKCGVTSGLGCGYAAQRCHRFSYHSFNSPTLSDTTSRDTFFFHSLLLQNFQLLAASLKGRPDYK